MRSVLSRTSRAPSRRRRARRRGRARSGATARQVRMAALLDLIYPLPTADDEPAVYAHHDLAGMTVPELEIERHRLLWRCAFEVAPPPWLAERRARVEAALLRAAPAEAAHVR